MKSLSISTRLWLPPLLVTGLLLMVEGWAVLHSRAEIENARAAMAAQFDKLDKTTQWAGLTEANAARALAALNSTDAGLGARLKPEIEATSARISTLQQTVEAQSTLPEEVTALEKVSQARKAYVDLRKQLGTARTAGTDVPEAEMSRLRGALAAYIGAQREAVSLQFHQADTIAERTFTQQSQTVAVVGVVMLGLAALLMTSTLLTARAILQPVQQVLEATNRIAGGDLGLQGDTSRQDEMGDMMRGLAHMVAALRTLVRDVRSGAVSMQSASAEIAVGNADLSRRTELAAGNLQETAASMSQLTSTVQNSTDAALQAHQLVTAVAEAATRGGSVVARVVQNMDEITASSRRIGDITGVIDGIAFQTNILALNAAVEAARAGEQGRGFAVVASEVRSLAQRSAEAAREIRSLIAASFTTVDHGAQLVRDAGSTISELVASVRQVSDIIGRITTASDEQNLGIRQIGQALQQLDDATQQNAALVEQSAAAADNLRDESLRLSEAVHKFRIEEPAQA
ncbi:methyl-accepting chemotaxis protein [Sphaerotilus sp.]|uniref:methyl-accepting chemotaxis protein n=1 Tax=Sphaerotilus sp. TaxID=2093942 RepID=UPI0034E1CA65